MAMRSTIFSGPSAALLAWLACAPALAWAGAPTPSRATQAQAAPDDGYGASAPQARAVDGKMNALIEARAAASCSKAWQVFTDFERMPEFLPDLESSAVTSREGSQVTLAQRGRHQYGIFSKSYESRRVLTLSEPDSIRSRSLPGDEMAIASSTTFAPRPEGGCSISYAATIELPGWAPDAAAAGFVKSLASSQMKAMLAEVKKRFGQGAPAPAEPAEPKPAQEPSQTEADGGR